MQSGGRQSWQDMELEILPLLSSSWLLQQLWVLWLWLFTDSCDPVLRCVGCGCALDRGTVLVGLSRWVK